MSPEAARFIPATKESAMEISGGLYKALNPLFDIVHSIDLEEGDVPPNPESDFGLGKYLWGKTRQFCPVSLVQSHALRPGRDEYSAIYQV